MSPTPALAPAAGPLEIQRCDQCLHYRYPINLGIEYRLRRKGQMEQVGIGETLNVSSGGVLFETRDALPVGRSIEVLMDWPFPLEGVYPLKLVMHGHVVRSDSKCAAVLSRHHEFRTAGGRWLGIRSSGDRVRSMMM